MIWEDKVGDTFNLIYHGLNLKSIFYSCLFRDHIKLFSLVGGLERFLFSHIFGIIITID